MLIGLITKAYLIAKCTENIKLNDQTTITEIIFQIFLKSKYGRGAG